MGRRALPGPGRLGQEARTTTPGFQSYYTLVLYHKQGVCYNFFCAILFFFNVLFRFF